MATSTLGVYTRFTETLANDEDPTDTGICYRALNNLNHLADQCSQPRVRWMIRAGEQGLTTEDAVSTSSYVFVYKSTAFDLHVKEDGSSYRCIGRLYMHSGSGSEQANFRAGLVPSAPGRAFSAAEIETDDVNVSFTARTATTFAWGDLNEPIYLTPEMVRRAAMDVTQTDTIGGTAVTVRVLSVQLHVYVIGSDLSIIPRLGGVDLQEYLAP